MKLLGDLAWGFAWGVTLVSWVSLYWINYRLISHIRDQQAFYDQLMADQHKLMAELFVTFRRYRGESVDDPSGP